MENVNFALVGLFVFCIVLVLILTKFVMSTYKTVGANEILIKTGKLFTKNADGSNMVAEVVHGGATFVIPFIQRSERLSLIPFPINVDLKGALTKENIRVHLPSNFMLRVSTNPVFQKNAAMSLTGLSPKQIAEMAQEIIIGQYRLAVSNMDINEINSDRDRFAKLVEQHVNTELNGIGIEIQNVNIEDIKDDAGILMALGKKAASEAKQKADIEVANAEKKGAIGVSEATKARQIEVTKLDAERETEVNQLTATKTQNVAQTLANQEQQIVSIKAKQAEQKASVEANQAVNVATVEADRRKQVATLEAETLTQENKAKAQTLEAETMLNEKKAEATKRVQVANAKANTEIIESQTLVQEAKLKQETILSQKIDNEKENLQADQEAAVMMKRANAKANARLVEAKAEAESILLVKKAEADGIEAKLSAEAKGYENLIKAVGGSKELITQMEMIKIMPQLAQSNANAISNIKFDKVTLIGGGENNSVSNFMQDLTKSLPAVHEIANAAGVSLPSILGKSEDK